MSSEPVSDKRLDELIERVKDDAKSWEFDWRTVRGADDDFGKQHEEKQTEIADELSLLTELKSRRAQQAEPPAGCAEMARDVYKIVAEEFINSGLYQWQDDHLEAEIAAHLKATKTLPIISAKLAPWCALLAECRESIGEYRGLCGCELDPECKHCRMTYTLLTKLDAALGKGGADGGREEGK